MLPSLVITFFSSVLFHTTSASIALCLLQDWRIYDTLHSPQSRPALLYYVYINKYIYTYMKAERLYDYHYYQLTLGVNFLHISEAVRSYGLPNKLPKNAVNCFVPSL
jgi:hypothetical protein